MGRIFKSIKDIKEFDDYLSCYCEKENIHLIISQGYCIQITDLSNAMQSKADVKVYCKDMEFITLDDLNLQELMSDKYLKNVKNGTDVYTPFVKVSQTKKRYKLTKSNIVKMIMNGAVKIDGFLSYADENRDGDYFEKITNEEFLEFFFKFEKNKKGEIIREDVDGFRYTRVGFYGNYIFKYV